MKKKGHDRLHHRLHKGGPIKKEPQEAHSAYHPKHQFIPKFHTVSLTAIRLVFQAHVEEA